MVNLYKVKVYAALILSPFITVLAFFIVLNFYGFFWSLAGLAGGLLVSVIVSKVLISNPFSRMLEGQGILAHNIDSTGIIRPFIVQVDSPYIKNRKEGVDDVFDRNAVWQYAIPLVARKPMEMLDDGGIRLTLDKDLMIKVLDEKSFGIIDLQSNEYRIMQDSPKSGFLGLWGKPSSLKIQLTQEALLKVREATKENIVVVELSEKEYNAARFALWHYPSLIWNDQIKSMLTKDFMAGQEKEAFAEHQLLYLNRKAEELTSAIRDFGRYVVEMTKPKDNSWLNSKWTWIIIAIVIIIILAMFAPAIINAIKGTTGGGAATAVKSAFSTAGGAITPVQ